MESSINLRKKKKTLDISVVGMAPLLSITVASMTLRDQLFLLTLISVAVGTES